MTISDNDNVKKSYDTKQLIANLKKALSHEDLKIAVQLLSELKKPDYKIAKFSEQIRKLFFKNPQDDLNETKIKCLKELVESYVPLIYRAEVYQALKDKF